MAILPSMVSKTISFKRMNSKHVKEYEIYGLFKDDTYASGIRRDLLDRIDNPNEPNTQLTEIPLEYNQSATWELPEDIYLDREHKFKLFVNNAIVSSLFFQYNKYNRLLTIDKNLKPIQSTDIITLQYFRDRIVREYRNLEENCKIEIVPIYADTYTYGNHNVII